MAENSKSQVVDRATEAAEVLDVVVVGGGFAGLSAALTLVRARRSVVVIDAGRPRNAPAAHSHGYLTRDGASPLEILRIGRLEVRGYGGRIVEGEVSGIAARADGRFTVDAGDAGTYVARRILVTTGLIDEYPDIPGLHERWGKDVVHCPYCFGWEHRDRALAVLAFGPHAVSQALMWRQWSEDVTLLVHREPEPGDEDAAKLARRGVRTVHGVVTAIDIENERVRGVRLEDGTTVPCDTVVIAPQFEARHELLEQLGAEIVSHPFGMGHHVKADVGGFTGIAGIWVAGNVADLTAGVMQAAASGVTAAAGLNADLIAEESAAR